MFGVTVDKWDTPVWHDSVSAYQIKENGEVIGQFYLDMFPRENKYKHAAHFGIRSGITGKQLPVSVLVCNFPGKDDDTELMEHGQVETFLHEFGHMMHHLLAGKHEWLTFSGISTEWDFVEAPSQMLEEWIWNIDVLQKFAINKQGDPIPEALVKKSIAAKNFGIGLWTKHQMFYASISLNFYNRNPDKLNLSKELKTLQNRYSSYEHVDETYMYANFGHLYGYSAIYYTYMWSQVIAKDLFSRFEDEGLMNRKTAREYRKSILEPGGSKDADELIKDFLGRPFTFDAYANWLNRK
jgi:thimet oligopeptidase